MERRLEWNSRSVTWLPRLYRSFHVVVSPVRPRHGEPGPADGGERAAEGLELVLVVAGVVETFVAGEQPLVEDGEGGQEVA
ncbi:hypothetical protein [Streptomyces mirabilis]|uniref:hypothetical protein n=1 Tax=Streptomyces mirabilis TaxID=68239 RepID=UPI003328EF54